MHCIAESTSYLTSVVGAVGLRCKTAEPDPRKIQKRKRPAWTTWQVLIDNLFQRWLFPLLSSKITMSRSPPIHPSELSASQIAALNEVKALSDIKPELKMQDSNGALIGTFGPLSYVSLLVFALIMSWY